VTAISVQGLEVAIAGGALLFAVVWLTRRGLLSLRYGLGWIAVAGLVLASSALLGLVGAVARSLHVTPTGLLLGASSSFLLLLALQLSISVSGLQDAVRDLSESNALLEQRIQESEQRSSLPDGRPESAVGGRR
jgi:uncharacterized protein DUF2304